MEELPWLNVNVAVMGHVDTGKTAVVRALSETLSTAALDKHPASRERGVTLDLGFSCFRVPVHDTGDEVRQVLVGYAGLQFTLIDCPGHASLLRTVLMGASVMDLMLLVVDAAVGVQAQTVECLVVGEVLTDRLVVALNKVDRVAHRMERVGRLERALRVALRPSRFGDAFPIVRTTAVTSCVEKCSPSTDSHDTAFGMSGDAGGMGALRAALVRQAHAAIGNGLLRRRQQLAACGALVVAVDHGFSVRGHGTVFTGTVLSGSAQVGQEVFIPAMEGRRRGGSSSSSGGGGLRIKSMQVFHRPVPRAAAGDRVALCVAGAGTRTPNGSAAAAAALHDKFERGLIGAPRTAFHRAAHGLLVALSLVPAYFGHRRTAAAAAAAVVHGEPSAPHSPPSSTRRRPIAYTGQSLHVMAGMETVRVRIAALFRAPGEDGECEALSTYPPEHLAYEEDHMAAAEEECGSVWALLTSPTPVFLPAVSIADASLSPLRTCIALHLDGEATAASPTGGSPSSRIAFIGTILRALSDVAGDEALPPLYRNKCRCGVVERVIDDGRECVVRGLFDRDVRALEVFLGMEVRIVSRAPEDDAPAASDAQSRWRGRLARPFGQSGKVVVQLQLPDRLPSADASDAGRPKWQVQLSYRRRVHASTGPSHPPRPIYQPRAGGRR